MCIRDSLCARLSPGRVALYACGRAAVPRPGAVRKGRRAHACDPREPAIVALVADPAGYLDELVDQGLTDPARDVLVDRLHRPAHGGIPVSYTHLDVYKRQQARGQYENDGADLTTVGTATAIDCTAIGARGMTGLGGSRAVSYTHLDVYKRQFLGNLLLGNIQCLYVEIGRASCRERV